MQGEVDGKNGKHKGMPKNTNICNTAFTNSNSIFQKKYGMIQK